MPSPSVVSSPLAAPSLVALEAVHLNLASSAGEVNVLRGIDLDVGEGETLGVVGPSGSGKSTLLMVMAGLERPSSGVVRVAGFDLGGMDEDGLARFRRDHVGIVFQSFHLIPTMTALENAAVPLELAGRRDAFTTAAEALRRVGLGERLDHYPGQLSGGEQQRVAICRALANSPRVLLADEPTGNLDPHTAEGVFDELIKLVRGSGVAALIATHNPDLARRMDRIIRLQDGLLVEG